MAVLYHIWVPAFVVAHLLGLGLLMYSLEKVSGGVSKAWKRLWRIPGKANVDQTGKSEKSSTEGSSSRSVQLVATAQVASAGDAPTVRLFPFAFRTQAGNDGKIAGPFHFYAIYDLAERGRPRIGTDPPVLQLWHASSSPFITVAIRASLRVAADLGAIFRGSHAGLAEG